MTIHSQQDQRYLDAVAKFGRGLFRLARTAEANAGRQHDLLQDIHVAIWRSFALFDGLCSVATWIYRVAHNATASYVARQQRHGAGLSNSREIDQIPDSHSVTDLAEEQDALSDVWRWYLAPFIPGILLYILGNQFTGRASESLSANLLSSAMKLAVVAAIYYVIHWLNRRETRKLDREIAELEGLL